MYFSGSAIRQCIALAADAAHGAEPPGVHRSRPTGHNPQSQRSWTLQWENDWNVRDLTCSPFMIDLGA